MGRRIEAAPNVYSMMLFNAAESCGSGKWEVGSRSVNADASEMKNVL